jgi:hypothetical protein
MLLPDGFQIQTFLSMSVAANPRAANLIMRTARVL